ncbi:hypothetical protein VSDG_07153 [Cytospora chrysosperma]|uniref:rRNA processing protein Ebp2 n=1 Tax=Cytospora chrysosperma TaxID=252740 RepID=A0A423VKL0_CYTCH|nr:hypothetical protein VSDG_07153 [Valsa sordida]
MAPRSKLKIALAAEKGLTDLKLKQIRDKKKHKAVVKDKIKKGILPAKKEPSDTDSESEVDMEEKIERIKKPKSILKKGETQPTKKAADLAEEDREDLYVQTRLTINNQPALLAALKRISIPKDSSVAFVTHQTVVSSEPTASKIEDISDDLNRELQLYAQSLEAAKRARAALRAEGAPFARPKDYFAEMVKDDGHMQKVKEKLVEDATNKKASAEARKLRDLKKFGKQVQVAKLQERQKEKKDTLEKIKALKKKRSENGGEMGTTEADLFDVAVDNELNKPGKRSRGGDDHQGGRAGGNNKRAKKDAKFGFGGKKRHGKSGDAASSGDLSGFSAKRMKGKGGAAGPSKPKPYKAARPGKDKRKAAAGRR